MKNILLIRTFIVLISFLIAGPTIAKGEEKKVEDFNVLTNSGAWCWFADSRAIYYKGEKEQTYFSWVSNVGDIMIASYNHQTGEYLEHVVHDKLEIDDHDAPALLIREDGRIIIFYSKHQYAGPMQRAISTNPEDITSWSTNYTWGSNVSYPNPFQVEDDIYMVYRGLNWHPTLAISDDNGETFPNVRQLVLGGGARPYARYCQSEDGSIHVAVTTGHPRDEEKNKIYYFRLKDNHFYKADGSLIKEFTIGINLDNNEAEVVYDGESNGRGWIWDLTIDPETQNPIMLYASFPEETDHRYNHAYWDGNQWVNKEITKAGKWFPQTPSGQTEKEPHYSGGLSFDHNNPSVIYLSKPVNDIFEIFKYTTDDKGETWAIEAITENTPEGLVNVRPIVPRNHKEGYFDVLWMRGTYEYYFQKYQTSIVYQMKEKTDDIQKIEMNKSTLILNKGRAEVLTVSFYPIIVNDKTIKWTSSDESVATVEMGKVTALNEGTVTITAESLNGKTTTCIVTVTKPDYLTNAYFDFGTDTSPLDAGAIRVTETTILTKSYGWLSPVISRDRGSSLDNEKRDFNMYSEPSSFIVYVENGSYKVTILQGDRDYGHDNMQIKLNDEVMASGITCTKGQFITTQFDATIQDNIMDFEFSINGTDPNWIVNSIKIEYTGTSIDDIDPFFTDPSSKVSVFDIMGKKLMTEVLGNRNYYSFLENCSLPKGVYILKIEVNNQVYKIIKQSKI